MNLVCIQVPSTTLDRPGAARITVRAAIKSAVTTEAATDRMLSWLQDNICSAESYSLGTISPEIELGEILEFEAGALIDFEPRAPERDN